jgi:hypothetical protein
MKTKILIPILGVFAAAIVYLFIAYKPGVKQPVYYQNSISVPVQERLIETSGVDYATNLVVDNIMQFTPTTAQYNLGLPRDIFQLYYDKVNEDFRGWDGNYPEGVKVVFGKFADDVITITTSQDTVYFPMLLDDFAYNVAFKVTSDTIDALAATVNIQQVDHADSTYVGINDSVFPYTIPSGETELKFVGTTALRYQRAIIDWDTASMGTITIAREITTLR